MTTGAGSTSDGASVPFARREPGDTSLRIFEDPAALAAAGADLFVLLAAKAVGERGRFSVALSGGSTPKAMFELLAGDGFRARVDWGSIDLFWSDERAVPPEDERSNYGMAKQALLDRVPVPARRIHRVQAERTPLMLAADEYAALLRRTLGVGEGMTPRLDLVMLGMGDEGHTASLFPHTEALYERQRLVAPNYVPKLDAQRVTFTPKLINAAANVLFLIAGASKAGAVQAVLEGPYNPEEYPSQLVQPESGTLLWYLDREAAAKLNGVGGGTAS